MWSAEEHVAVMNRLGIECAVLSVSSPGVQFGEWVSASDAIDLAHHVNDVAVTNRLLSGADNPITPAEMSGSAVRLFPRLRAYRARVAVTSAAAAATR